MSEQSNSFRTALNRFALALLRGTKRTILAIWPAIARTSVFLGRMVTRVFILPPYRLAMNAKLRSRRLMLPARGLTLLVFTNRYLLHVVIVAVAVATVGVNLAGRQANAQDVGQQSLLYAMVTGSDARVTEQDAQAETLVRDSHYAGPSSLLAVPDVDFDYTETDQPPLTAIAVPGTIIAEPTSHVPDEPGRSTAPRIKTEDYVVQSGDTLSTIAYRFGVTVGTLLWANSRTELQYLRPGDVLRVPPVSGVLVTVKKGDTLLSLANKYGSDADEVIRVNRLAPDESLATGAELVMPGGQPPAVALTYVPRDAMPSSPTRVVIGKDGIPRNPATPPPVNYAKPADEDASSVPVGKLVWPTSGHVITQYYGWKHTGVDIDGDYSSPIYASHDGVVTTAGWNSGGYGMQILITGSGVMTRYGHTSKMFVKLGDTVKKGQVIAMVGTTGRSTGTHLHFEVYIGGKRTNPLAYIR